MLLSSYNKKTHKFLPPRAWSGKSFHIFKYTIKESLIIFYRSL